MANEQDSAAVRAHTAPEPRRLIWLLAGVSAALALFAGLLADARVTFYRPHDLALLDAVSYGYGTLRPLAETWALSTPGGAVSPVNALLHYAVFAGGLFDPLIASLPRLFMLMLASVAAAAVLFALLRGRPRVFSVVGVFALTAAIGAAFGVLPLGSETAFTLACALVGLAAARRALGGDRLAWAVLALTAALLASAQPLAAVAGLLALGVFVAVRARQAAPSLIASAVLSLVLVLPVLTAGTAPLARISPADVRLERADVLGARATMSCIHGEQDVHTLIVSPDAAGPDGQIALLDYTTRTLWNTPAIVDRRDPAAAPPMPETDAVPFVWRTYWGGFPDAAWLAADENALAALGYTFCARQMIGQGREQGYMALYSRADVACTTPAFTQMPQPSLCGRRWANAP
jgi:hypothetical protein